MGHRDSAPKNMHNIAFPCVESHTPCISPPLQGEQGEQGLLKENLVVLNVYGPVHGAVMSEKPHLRRNNSR